MKIYCYIYHYATMHKVFLWVKYIWLDLKSKKLNNLKEKNQSFKIHIFPDNIKW